MTRTRRKLDLVTLGYTPPMFRKHRLLTPGPAPVHPRASATAAEPLPHHRGPLFSGRFACVQEGLRRAFRTHGPVAVLAASGSGAMEAAVVNFLAPDERALVLAAGKFGLRWAEIAAAYGIDAVTVEAAPGQTFTPAMTVEAIERHAPVAAVCITVSETSTGAALDTEAVAAAARRAAPDAALLVDAVTGVGALPVHTDEWDLDAVCGGSQKAFMIPPGLGFVACSPRGWERVAEPRPRPRYFFDLRKYAASADRGPTPFTPATGLILQLEAALAVVEQEGGIGALEQNAQRLAAATRAAARALQLELLAPESPSPAVTAIRAPRPGQGPEIVARLRDEYGIQIAGGQGGLKPDLFRIGHLGYIDETDLIGTLGALERVLGDLGEPVSLGTGVEAASRLLADSRAVPAE